MKRLRALAIALIVAFVLVSSTGQTNSIYYVSENCDDLSGWQWWVEGCWWR